MTNNCIEKGSSITFSKLIVFEKKLSIFYQVCASGMVLVWYVQDFVPLPHTLLLYHTYHLMQYELAMVVVVLPVPELQVPYEN